MSRSNSYLRVRHFISLIHAFVQIPIITNAAPHPQRDDYTITVTTEECDGITTTARKNVDQTYWSSNSAEEASPPDFSNWPQTSWSGETNTENDWNLHGGGSFPTGDPGPFGHGPWGISSHSTLVASSSLETADPTSSPSLQVSQSSPVMTSVSSSSLTDQSSQTVTSSSSRSSVAAGSPLLPAVSDPISTITSLPTTQSSSITATPAATSTQHPSSPSTLQSQTSSAISSTATSSSMLQSQTSSAISSTATSSPVLQSQTSSAISSSATSSVAQVSTSASSSNVGTLSSTTSTATSVVDPTSSSSLVPVTTSAQIGSLTSISTSTSTSTLTSTSTSTSSLSLIDTSSLASLLPTATSAVQTISAADIFQAVATDSPPAQITTRSDHPVPTLGIQPQAQRLETNKFYANFFLGSQTAPTWTHPYSVAWSNGFGETGSWGLAVTHVERDQLAGAGTKQSWDAGDWGYFVNPTGLQSVALSAAELSNGTTLTTDSLEGFSVNVNLAAEGANTPVMTFPIVQGMAFVTAVYDNGTPVLQSGLGIDSFDYVDTVAGGNTYKYSLALGNGFTWLIYVTPDGSQISAGSFSLDSGVIRGPSGFSGYIQVAKIPANSPTAESLYDQTAAVYPTAAILTGSVQGTSGSYTLTWTKAGNTDRTLLMYALPHHVDSFSADTQAAATGVQLVTTTKGYATAVRADSWTLDEPDLPIDMGFAPWTPQQGDIRTVSAAAQQAISSAGNAELQQNISQQTDTGSLYYDGKALAKFATICVTLFEVADNAALALTGLETLKEVFAFHVNNEMPNPLVYDDVWGGAVSVASYRDGNFGDDFGNTVYNDHHFHFGYFVYAAAVIGYLDSAWLTEGTNKAWVNMLVRDYANSVTDDAYFPFSRMYDWYHGHSWAHGLIETFDGKDQESSSEDTMSLYAVKMWGRVIGDTNMEARGNLMLSVQARALQHYYLYTNDNTVQPAQFIGNRAAGILFENKMDHTTYFGNVAEYIEGIHMLPLMPSSTLTRTPELVQQEWSSYFADSGIRPASVVTGGWKGVIMANYAITNPQASYEYMTTIPEDELDGGASQTWYLAFSAALGGSPAASKIRREPEDESVSAADQGEQVGQKVSPRHHGDAYKLRSDGVGMPGAEVRLPSDETSKKLSHHRKARRNHGDAYRGHEFLTNITATVTETVKRMESKRSSRLRQRTRGLAWWA